MTTLKLQRQIDAPQEAPFYIVAKGSPTRSRYRLKHNDTFAVIDSHGDIGASSGEPDGVFDNDTRFLSRLELRLNGHGTLLLGGGVRDDNSMTTVHLTNPDIFDGKTPVLAKDSIHVVRTCFVWNKSFQSRISVRNYGCHAVDLNIDVLFENDFADIFEVRGMQRQQRGRSIPSEVDGSRVTLSYVGLDDVCYRSSLNFMPQPSEFRPGVAKYRFRLDPGERTSIFITMAVDGGNGSVDQPTFFESFKAATRVNRRGIRSRIGIGTSSDIFNQVIARSLSDLRLLMTETPQGEYPYAGIPWYSTTFGRDGLITALQLLWCMPSVAKGTLRRLAALQATEYDPVNDAEPGKIIHEMRGGEMARLREVPFARYYGSVDATPLFVLLAGEHFARTLDDSLMKEIWPNIQAALRWIDEHSREDPHGLLRHSRNNDGGLSNQGWKDSYDSIFHADGRLAEGSIALIEVQAYVVAAKRSIAAVASRLGEDRKAQELRSQAEHLATKIDQLFWSDRIGNYGIALDGAGELCEVQTSNAGHLLFAGAISAAKARQVASTLMSSKFLSGWGIRTVADGEVRYNPMSYHNGSIWPHDNALFGIGLDRYSLKLSAATLFEAMIGAASRMDLQRLPELFCGFARSRGQSPTLYPVACSPQAWASAAPLGMLQACLGIRFEPEQNRIYFERPVLPSFVDMIVLQNLELNGGLIDVGLFRSGDSVSAKVLKNEGNIQVEALNLS
jgi:glycogen debranching enzyme